MTAVTVSGAEQLSWLDERLLALDPDLEELFAEVDDILRAPVPPRPHPEPAPDPRPWRPGARGPAAEPGDRPAEPTAPGGRGPPARGGVAIR